MTGVRNKIAASVLCGLIFSVLLGMTGFNAECEGIRQSVFRVHIIANSDSQTDQQLKLTVRNRLLVLSDNLFAECKNEEQAIKLARENIDLFRDEAKKTIQQQGFDYPVKVTVDKAYFDTRVYEGFTLPAGKYDALKVVIGSGRGKNWWCVMFPAVCVPAATDTDISDALDKRQSGIVKNPTRYRLGFKTVEIYEQLKELLKG